VRARVSGGAGSRASPVRRGAGWSGGEARGSFVPVGRPVLVDERKPDFGLVEQCQRLVQQRIGPAQERVDVVHRATFAPPPNVIARSDLT
jgi:hypothetical protein